MYNEGFLKGFFEKNPYDGFDYREFKQDLQGWGSEHPVLYDVVKAIRPGIVVEVGTWKGATAIRMAQTLKENEIPGIIICVDTWLGGVEHFIGRVDPNAFAALNLKHGYPQLYYQFLANVLHTGHQDMIVPLPQTSSNAAKVLKTFDIKADLIYIDASHEEIDVYRDLEDYWEILTDDGVIIGDDYNLCWHGVVKAAKRFARQKNLQYYLNEEKFLFFKSGQRSIENCVPEDNRWWNNHINAYAPLPPGQF